jgi:hypothetical protein
MDCAECTRLLAEYGGLSDIHFAAVQALNAGRPTATALEYVRLTVAADQAWLGAERARQELQQHKREHNRSR